MDEGGTRHLVRVLALAELALTLALACSVVLLGAINDTLFEVLVVATAVCAAVLIVTLIAWLLMAMLRRP